MKTKQAKVLLRIYPGMELQDGLDEIRIWCKSNDLVFSSLFRERMRELIRVFKDNPDNLRKL